jgi:hypothetical protein
VEQKGTGQSQQLVPFSPNIKRNLNFINSTSVLNSATTHHSAKQNPNLKHHHKALFPSLVFLVSNSTDKISNSEDVMKILKNPFKKRSNIFRKSEKFHNSTFNTSRNAFSLASFHLIITKYHLTAQN